MRSKPRRFISRLGIRDFWNFWCKNAGTRRVQLPVLSQEKIKPQSDESVRLEMTLSKDEMELVKATASQQRYASAMVNLSGLTLGAELLGSELPEAGSLERI